MINYEEQFSLILRFVSLQNSVVIFIKIDVANETAENDQPFCFIRSEGFALLSCSLEKDYFGLQLYFAINSRFEHVVAALLDKRIFLSFDPLGNV